jgi:hypothetical protein
VATYVENIRECHGRLMTFNEMFPIAVAENEGTTQSEIFDLLVKDPDAIWDDATKTVRNSCAPDDDACGPVSPRLVPIALFDADLFQLMRATDDWSACPGNAPCVKAVNYAGFFIEDVTSGGVSGRWARYPGMISEDYPSVVQTASFLPTVTLVR